MQRLKVTEESSGWLCLDKPSGFHTHPPEDKKIRLNPRWNAQGILERQYGQALYPVHRLDRAASGLVLYSRHRQWNRPLQEQFASREVKKIYYVLARGKLEGEAVFDSPLANAAGQESPAYTQARACFTFSLPIPHPRGGWRDFTVARVEPSTGRFHQIRRHFAGAGLPLLGDSTHGDRKLNREFAALTGCRQLFLRCLELEFRCPLAGERITIGGRWNREWHRLFDQVGACAFTASPFRARP